MSVLEGLESHCSGRRSGAGFGLRHGGTEVPALGSATVQPCSRYYLWSVPSGWWQGPGGAELVETNALKVPVCLGDQFDSTTNRLPA